MIPMIFKRRSLFIWALLVPTTAYAQTSFTLASRKSTLQISPKNTVFTGGTLSVNLSDGSVVISPCAFNGTPFSAAQTPFQPSILCTLGTTAYITSGDFDGDGLSDIGQWWSLAQAPSPAAEIAPNRPDRVSVVSAPPSLFPRPGIFPTTDSGFSLYYDMLSGVDNRPYQIAAYRYDQLFAATSSGRVEHDETIVTGSYQFAYPDIDDPSYTTRAIVLNKVSLPEGWPGLSQSPVDSGFRFTDDDAWGSATNSMEFDPRFANTVHWTGVNLENSNPLFDQVRLFIRIGALADPTVLPTPENLPLGFDPAIIFPPFGIPTLLRPDEMYANGYEIPPNLLNFVIGQPCVFYFRFDRSYDSSLNAGFGISDVSSRTFGVNVTFVDSYAGDALFAFPALTSTALRSPTADFDNDGVSNLIEFALGSDPADVASVPAPLVVAPAGLNTQVTITKRPNVGSTLTYAVEYSTDMVTWIKVDAANPDWTVTIDDATQVVVTSNAPLPLGPFFVRAAITLN